MNHYLTYPHLWIQLVSCQLFGVLFWATHADQIFSQQKPDDDDDTDDQPYLMTDREKGINPFLPFLLDTSAAYNF